MILSKIFVYPIKSLGGISVQAAEVQERGLRHDRRWLLIDDENQFLTQRSRPEMALISTEIVEEGLRVWHRKKPKLGVLNIPFEPQTADNLQVRVWDDTMLAIRVNDEADAWFSEALGMSIRLVFMPDNSARLADSKYAPFDNNVSFADGYPYLIIGQSSLDDLNKKLTEVVGIERFRPNFVVEGSKAFAEDSWQEFCIGDLRFLGVKPCARCVLTTIDPQTAETGKEPLRTLAAYRSRNNKVLFGQNVLAKDFGVVEVGNEIKIQSQRD